MNKRRRFKAKRCRRQARLVADAQRRYPQAVIWLTADGDILIEQQGWARRNVTAVPSLLFHPNAIAASVAPLEGVDAPDPRWSGRVFEP